MVDEEDGLVDLQVSSRLKLKLNLKLNWHCTEAAETVSEIQTEINAGTEILVENETGTDLWSETETETELNWNWADTEAKTINNKVLQFHI